MKDALRASAGGRTIEHVSEQARKLLQEAMCLTVEERVLLVDSLIASLPGDAETVTEIERRARRTISDPDGGEPWELVRDRIREQKH